MQDPNTAPAIVRTLASQVDMTPIDWAVHPDHVVIVFEQGPKLTFECDAAPRPDGQSGTVTSTTPAVAPGAHLPRGPVPGSVEESEARAAAKAAARARKEAEAKQKAEAEKK